MCSLVHTVILAMAVSFCRGDESAEEVVGPLLSTFQGVQHEVQHHEGDGIYKFFFTLPQQERAEERDAYGKVIGSFAFVDPYGQETSVNFDAGEDGYVPQSDALPQPPLDTAEVQKARQEFFASYRRVAEYLDDLHSDEDDSDDESSEESFEDLFGESSEEDSDEDDKYPAATGDEQKEGPVYGRWDVHGYKRVHTFRYLQFITAFRTSNNVVYHDQEEFLLSLDSTRSKMNSLVQIFVVALAFSLAMGDDSEEYAGPLLSTFQGVQHEVQHHGNDGVYKFFFTLPQQERAEERDTYGKVLGSFAFVDPYGQETSVNFDAGEYGYVPQINTLLQVPVDTPEVALARQEFLASYQRVAEYLEDLHSDEDSESSEESLEDSFGESSEESDEDSEEDSEEEDEKKK
ncbi:uncharacterized protein LOC143019902 [Oratosquilla oratoria]|uniref:uncharacterized protein LOC143019902 n=1 Tax=Oratosquilla oratoria TaxID=337810 RepID=UPI003F773924